MDREYLTRPILAGAAISVIGKCNYQCIHCYAKANSDTDGIYSPDTIASFVEILKEYGVKTVFLGGGEPLLHSKIDEIIQKVIQLDVLPSMTTNGSLLDENKIEKIHKSGMKHNLYISLEGSTPAVNDRIRGKGSYKKTLNGIKILSKYSKINFAITTVVSRLNINSSNETVKLVKELGARFYNLVKITRDGRGDDNWEDLRVSTDEFLNEVCSIWKNYQYVGGYYTENAVFNMREKKTTVKFIQDDQEFKGFPSGISIFHDGSVRLTPMRLPIGNVRDEPLHKIISKCYSEPVLSKYRQWALVRQKQLIEDVSKLKSAGFVLNKSIVE